MTFGYSFALPSFLSVLPPSDLLPAKFSKMIEPEDEFNDPESQYLLMKF